MAENATTVPNAATVVPGWKTTEFWLSLLAAVVGIVMASGIIPATSTWEKIVGIVASVLSALGYQVMRTSVKTNAQSAALVMAKIEADSKALVAAGPVAPSAADALKDAAK